MEEALTALLADAARGRHYWVRAPQNINAKDGPYLVLTRISGVRDSHYQGESGFVDSRVQMDIYAATYADVIAVWRIVRTVLSGHRCDNIEAIFIDSERDLPASDAGEVNRLFRKSIDIIILHTEN